MMMTVNDPIEIFQKENFVFFLVIEKNAFALASFKITYGSFMR
jgi:hypothetical protein